MANIFTESFETDGNGTRYITSVPEFSDGSGDFFTRTDGTNISGSYIVAEASGSFYFPAQDIDGEGADSQQTLTFSGLDISGVSNLGFSALFAEDNSSDGNEDWDASDFFKVEYAIDDNGFQNLLAFENDGSTFNTAPSQDTDFDGVGDGSEVTDTFSTFASAIAGTGSSLDLRFTFDLDSGDEDIAIDNIQITGDTAEPAATLISEFQPNPTGADPSDVTFELSGAAGEAFSGWIVSIEGDPSTNPSFAMGTIDRAAQVTGTFDANGLLSVTIPDLENPSFTVALLSDFTGSIGDDIDTDDDGTADSLSLFGTVLDAIGVPDTAGDEAFLYGAQLGGTDFAFTGDEPRLIFRDASVGNLYAVNDPDNGEVIDINGNAVPPSAFGPDPTTGTDTFGVINPTLGGVVEPTTIFAIAPDTAVQPEGDAGSTDFTFTVTRSGDISAANSVDFAVSGDVDAADFGGSLPTGTINFAATETSQTITIGVFGDTDTELDESFTVTISNPTNGATISTETANGTIQNDDDVALTLISTVQGSGSASPLDGQTVTVEAVVVGDFQDGAAGTNGDLNGFFIQEEGSDADGDVTTSEGLFIFDGSSPAVDVQIGDTVQITGTVDEFFDLTQLTDVSVSVVNNVLDVGGALPTAATANFPVNSVDDLEAFEGMQITIPDELFVTEYFNLDRFGEIDLSSDGDSNAPGTDGRLDQFTQFNDPSTAGFAAYQADIAKRRIKLDDGQSIQNPDSIIFGRGGTPLSATNTLRGGDTIEGLSGVLSFGFGDYRIQPVAPVDFQATNLRPNTPEDVGGNLKVVSFNVLNFFTTIDAPDGPGSGPNNLEPRGADDLTRFGVNPATAEFDRQLEKLITTLETIDADIVGLIEIENEFGGDQNGDGQFAIETLVNALNDKVGAGTYAFADPGREFVDTGDAISVGAIYKTSTVDIAEGTTVEILDDAVVNTLGLGFTNPVFDGVSTNRASLAVTFEEKATGEKLTVAVNHYKSKGSVNGADGNADIGDGAGNNNAIRLQASQALNAWLNTDPTGSEDSDFLIIGDLNAYAKEDPVTFLEENGYTNVAENPESAYSFVFDGQLGTLDYGLANATLISQVTGATEWHVNADEPDALDYNLDFGRNPNLFAGDEPFRNSDHDPLIIGLELTSDSGTDPDQTLTGTNRADTLEGGSGNDTITGKNGNDLLIGNDGNDELFGGNGRDELLGSDGNDILDGGSGNDILDGGSGNDTLDGSNGRDELTGGDGNDELLGGNGTDILSGGNDDDILSGGNGRDTLTGGSGNDTLTGGGGRDELFGEEGDDILTGGGGRDLLNGGTGIDTVEYAGVQDDFRFSGTADNFTVRGPGIGRDSVISVEFLQFENALVSTANLFSPVEAF